MNYIPANLDDLVFQGRNRDCGAYNLRKKYQAIAIRAFIISCSALLLITFLPAIDKFMTDMFKGVEVVEKKMDKKDIEAKLMEPPPAMNEKEPPPPPPPTNLPPPPKIAEIQFVAPKVEDKAKVKEDETIKNVDEVLKADANIGTKDSMGDKPSVIPDMGQWENGRTDGKHVEIIFVEKEPDPNEFLMAEQEPKPLNLGDLKANIGYPPMAKEAGIQGKVTVRVLIDKTGAYSKHIIIKTPHASLTKAVEDQIRNLKCTPGIQAGKPIKIWMTVPFDFKLKN